MPSETRRGGASGDDWPRHRSCGGEHGGGASGGGGGMGTEQAHWHGRWENAGAAQRKVWPLVVDGAFIVLCAVVMVCGVTQALQRL